MSAIILIIFNTIVIIVSSSFKLVKLVKSGIVFSIYESSMKSTKRFITYYSD